MGKKKKLTRKRMWGLIGLIFLGLAIMVGAIFIVLTFDLYAKKFYVTAPCVILMFISPLIMLYALFNLMPYAKAYDKKKLKKKTFKCEKLQEDFELYKDRIISRSTAKDGDYFLNHKKMFFDIEFRVSFLTENEIQTAIAITKKYNKEPYRHYQRRKPQRYVDVLIIECEKLDSQFKELEELLDEQYLQMLKDPIKISVPIIYEKQTNSIYYYEKWSAMNITLLKSGTNDVKKWFKTN